nr:acyltransferase family protein [Belnapia rosea]
MFNIRNRRRDFPAAHCCNLRRCGGQQRPAGSPVVLDLAGHRILAFAFAAGAALAMEGPTDPLLGPNRWAAWAVVIAATVPDSDLAVVVASVLLILLARGEGVFPALLRHPIPLWLGRMSYSLYLIHVPVMLAVAHALHGAIGPLAITALGVVLAFPLAWALYVGAERPALALSRLIGTCIRPATATSQAAVRN